MYRNGTLEKFLSRKNLKMVSTDTAGGSGTRRTLDGISQGVPPKKKARASAGYTQCILGADGNYYPIQS